MPKGMIALAAVLGLGLFVAPASACWDNSDEIVEKMETCKLSKDQLKKVFALKADFKKMMAATHKKGKSCRIHEDAEITFKANAIGILTDEQFEKLNGRKRTAVEQLRHENLELKDQIEALKKQVAELKKLIKTKTDKD